MDTLSLKKEKVQYSLQSARQIFFEELSHIYWAEKQQLKVLKRAEKAASTKYLRASFKGHFFATEGHVAKLKEAFKRIGEKEKSRTCYEITTLIEEVSGVIKATEKNTLSRDLGLIHLAKKIEHLEIKKYNNLINLANELGDYPLVQLLDEILLEEQEAEETFSAVMEDTQKDESFKANHHDETPEEEEILLAV